MDGCVKKEISEMVMVGKRKIFGNERILILKKKSFSVTRK